MTPQYSTCLPTTLEGLSPSQYQSKNIKVSLAHGAGILALGSGESLAFKASSHYIVRSGGARATEQGPGSKEAGGLLG